MSIQHLKLSYLEAYVRFTGPKLKFINHNNPDMTGSTSLMVKFSYHNE